DETCRTPRARLTDPARCARQIVAMRQFLAIAALVATGLLPGQDYVQAHGADDGRIGQPAVELAPDRAQLSAALRTAIRESFPQREVRIRVAGVDIDPAGPAQREVHARGRIL